MLCDVVMALIVTYSDGHKETVRREGSTVSKAKEIQADLAKDLKDPAFQAQLEQQGIKTLSIGVKKFKSFDCSQDPEAKPEGK